MAQDPQGDKKEDNKGEYGLTVKRKLNDGKEIPIFGLGTYIPERTQAQMQSGMKGSGNKDEDKVIVDGIACALKNGYIHIDSAQIYDTERIIMEGIKAGGKERKDIFITSKLSPSIHTGKDAKEWIERSAEHLGGYIDLFLMHAPLTQDEGKDVIERYKVMMDLVKQGTLKSIGVSNFNDTHLALMEKAGLTKPAINQIELHPFLRETKIVDYCNKNGIAIEAYSPMAKAKKMDNKVLIEIGKKHKKSVGQVMIRWSLQQGYIALPKSTNPKRIVENADVFDFNLDKDDLAKIDELGKENFRSTGWYAIDTKWNADHFKSS